jgi:signal transduction histidine kinase
LVVARPGKTGDARRNVRIDMGLSGRSPRLAVPGEQNMPVAINRLFGSKARRITPAGTWGLRLAAALQRPGGTARALEAACRLLLRGPCGYALVCTRPEAGPVRIVAGRARGAGAAALTEALGSKMSPVGSMGTGPRFARLADRPFGTGAPFLRRFDQTWLLALPFTADLGFGRAAYIFLAAGRQPDVDARHPLVREMELVWQAACAGTTTEPAVPGPWPGADGWETAPVALALVGRDQVLAANTLARDLLSASVGREGADWRPWLLGAVHRLQDGEVSRQTLGASLARQRSVDVALGPYLPAAGGWLVALQGEPSAPAPAQADRDAQTSTLGHELRTPLTAMGTAVALVSRGDAGPVTKDQARFLGMCQRNLDRLDRLVTDLLDSRRAAAGCLALNLEAVDLGVLLRESLELFEVTCRDKGVTLDYAGVPASFRACVDADKILQMFHNVTSNALKYTPRGGFVRVSLQPHAQHLPGLGAELARRFGLSLDAFTLVVEDSGLGMSEDFVARLFTPFSRDERAETRSVPGAGLGLHITQGLVEAMGGDIRLVSRAGEGTTVWLAIPREGEGARSLTAGRDLEKLTAAARAAGLAAQLVVLDLRRGSVAAEEAAAAIERAREFLARLARENAAVQAAGLAPQPARLASELAPGLLVGLALDPDRLAAAWEVTISAPRSGTALAGRRWELLEVADASVTDTEPCTVA